MNKTEEELMAERQKAKAVQRLGQMSACILAGEQGGLSWPPEYLVVEGVCTHFGCAPVARLEILDADQRQGRPGSFE